LRRSNSACIFLEVNVGNVERDEFGAAKRTSETNEKKSAVANVDSAVVLQVGDHPANVVNR
jgi:hypothetical protein